MFVLSVDSIAAAYIDLVKAKASDVGWYSPGFRMPRSVKTGGVFVSKYTTRPSDVMSFDAVPKTRRIACVPSGESAQIHIIRMPTALKPPSWICVRNAENTVRLPSHCSMEGKLAPLSNFQRETWVANRPNTAANTIGRAVAAYSENQQGSRQT